MVIKKRESQKFTNPNLLLALFQWWFTNLWIARGVALITFLNLGLVFFDLTYIPFRDLWLNGKVTVVKFKIGPYAYDGFTFRIFPPSVSDFVTSYDLVKRIVPYRDTDNYLKEVNKLQQSIHNYGLNSYHTEQILANLRQSSVDMINEDPFKLANKTGTLERIKNLMRQHMEPYIENPKDSSKVAFREFWTGQHLQGRTRKELDYFNTEISPLINTNYFRPIGETGDLIDYFGLIDFPFFVFIAIDFLGRSLYISWRYTGVNWLDGMLWRWYDLIFFLPKFRWLRVIPVTIRLDQTKLIDLKAIKKQASQGFVASIAEDLTEVIFLRVINQVQGLIQEGQIGKIISSQDKSQSYIDLNEINEIAEITKLMIQLTVYQVLPEIRPDVEALLEYSLEKAIIESPAYQNIKQWPNLAQLPKNVSSRIASQLYQVTLDTLNNLLKEDPVFEQYLQQIADKFSQTITSQIAAKESIERIEELLNDFLEEFKVNYVQRVSQEDVEELLEETRALRQATR
jgi:hypothetical protein